MNVNANIVCMTKWTPFIEAEGTPLYLALADAIERDVYAGTLQPGTRLPTHRNLADDLSVNVSTITRGYLEAERRGLVASTVGRGTFVSVDATTPAAMVSFEPFSPGLIEMGLATPMPHLDPDLNIALKTISRRKNPEMFLRYSDPRGLPEHREIGAQLVQMFGMSATADDIIVTAGSQHALSTALSAMFKPGDRIATDALTYPGFKSLAASLGIRLCPVAMDKGGMLPESLDTVCRQREVKGLYLLPHVQNPTVCCLSHERKVALAAVAKKNALTVIEDDAYAFLYDGDLVPLSSMLPDQSIFIAGISKMIGAGLRVGFMCVPKHLREACAQSILNSMWMVPPLNVEIVTKWIADGDMVAARERKRAEARRRSVLVRQVLNCGTLHMSGTDFFCWWELPEPWCGRTFEAAARKAGVNVFSAEKFIVGDAEAPRALRVGLTGMEHISELEKGLGILREIAQNPAMQTPLHKRKTG